MRQVFLPAAKSFYQKMYFGETEDTSPNLQERPCYSLNATFHTIRRRPVPFRRADGIEKTLKHPFDIRYELDCGIVIVK